MRLTLLGKIPYITLFCIFLFFRNCPAEETFPFAGEVNADDINIRSDATVNSQAVCIVGKGTRIDVISGSYDWYKIRLPRIAPSYIKKGMVECIEDTCLSAKVIKSRVNIRLYPNETSPILGQTDKNEIVNIRQEKGDWYKIEPILNSFAWINKKFVDKAPVITITNTKLSKKLKEGPKETSIITGEENITLIGIIKPYGKIFGRVATHKLVTQDKKTFLLKGDKQSLESLTNKRVKITGNIVPTWKQKYPVIEVKIMEAID